jgi:hypothetical protein
MVEARPVACGEIPANAARLGRDEHLAHGDTEAEHQHSHPPQAGLSADQAHQPDRRSHTQ